MHDSKWIDKEKTAPVLKKMLVFCSTCKNIHSVHFDYDDYCLAEECYENGHLFSGGSVNFRYYMALPSPPEVENDSTN